MRLIGRSVAVGMLAIAGAGFVGCGRSVAPQSNLSDVGSNVGTGNSAIFLYWQETDHVKRGQCAADKPLLRTYCQTSVVTRSLVDARARLIGDTEAKHTEHGRAKQELTSQLAAIDAALLKDPTNADLSGERERVALDLEKTASALKEVDQYLGLVNDFFEKLANGGIVHRIAENSERYAELKPIVRGLAAFFNQVPPPSPASSWTDPTTKRTFAAIADRYSWAGALTACQGLPGGTWRAITGYVGGSCNDDIQVGRRLFNSPIMKSIPETTSATDDENSELAAGTKLVWSRCFYDDNSNNRVAIGVNKTGELTHYPVASNRQLPVICERIK